MPNELAVMTTGPTPGCSTLVIHADAVNRAQAALLDLGAAERIAELFKVFGEGSRLRLLSALAVEELCVCDLGAVLGMSQSAISHQLALLRAARLVRNRRDGKVVYYRLDDDHVRRLLDLGREHAKERRTEKRPEMKPEVAQAGAGIRA
jgi:ArsR family transcriptional regulator